MFIFFSLQTSFSIMTLINANKRLRLKLERGNKSLLNALNSARKVETDRETLKKEKVSTKKSTKDQVTKFKAVKVRLPSLRFRLGG